MNIGLIICLLFGILFLCMTILFTFLGEKGADLISGFNSLPKEERNNYNKKKMSRDQRNSMLIWTLIMLIGALFSYLISQYIAIIAFVAWIIVFCKDVHTDNEKAFGKYKIK